MSTKPQPLPGVLELIPYVGGESKAEGNQRIIKLSSNEGALGPSPSVGAALEKIAGEMHRYPDGGSTELREAIGQRWGLDPARIVCGAGSDELITLLVRAYCAPGDNIVYSQHGFLMYAINATAAGAASIAVPEKDLTADIDAILAAINGRTRLVFLANPNNPTGSVVDSETVARLAAGLPPHVILVLDAAYAEYVSGNEYSAGAELVDRHPNVVMLRTFSKIFGLGGVRLGWAYCPDDIADVLNRVRSPFNVSLAAQAAGVAALADRAHMEAQKRNNDEMLPWFAGEVAKLGLKPWPSVGNFLLVDFHDAGKAEAARLALKADGILVRQMGGYGLGTCLRVTIGIREEMEAVVASLSAWAKQQGKG